MAQSLVSVIHRVFESFSTSYIGNYTTGNNDCIHKYMSVPLNGKSFFVPSFVIKELNKGSINSSALDTAVVDLYYTGTKAYYKSIDPNIRDVLRGDYNNSKLVSFYVSPNDIHSKLYYGTFGALFDEEYNPLMMIGWKLEKNAYEYDPTESLLRPVIYDFVSPVLWVSKEVFYGDKNPVKRYIVNKVIPAALSYAMVYPPTTGKNFGNYNKPYHPQVIIEDCPFCIKSAATPSVSTTNEQLINVALDNIQDIIL